MHSPSAFILKFSLGGDLIDEPIRVPLPAYEGTGPAKSVRASLVFDNFGGTFGVFGYGDSPGVTHIATTSAMSNLNQLMHN